MCLTSYFDKRLTHERCVLEDEGKIFDEFGNSFIYIKCACMYVCFLVCMYERGANFQ